MNVPRRPFFAFQAYAIPASSALALALAGCANPLATANVDSRSPVAAEVEAAAAAAKAYPTFADIPPVPDDQRPLKAWGDAAQTLIAEREQLERQTAPSTWTLSGTEGFAAAARDQVAAPEVAASSRAETEAFAAETRERATPPPPPR